MKNKAIILSSMLFLILFGLVMIYSSSYIWAIYKYHNAYKFVINQSIFFGLGIIIMFLVSRLDLKVIYKSSNYLLLVSFVLLILVLIPGVGVVRNGSRSWFGIGPFGIQPSEASKIALIIFTAKYLSNNYLKMKSIKSGIIPIMLVILLFFLLIMLEPDFGSAFVITMTLMAMLFVSNTKISYFFYLFLVGLTFFSGLIIIAPYRLKRILSFLNPWADPLGSGFQIIQSLYAIGPGGLFGQGFLNSVQKHFYLPEPQTDFIFAIISEEFGIVGVLAVVSLFLIIFYNSVKIAINSRSLFKKYLVFGLSFNLLFQAFLNLGVVVGLIPVTGVTLPFISYGGSSLLICMLSVGLVINV